MSHLTLFLAAFAGAALPVLGLVWIAARAAKAEKADRAARGALAYRAMIRDIMRDERGGRKDDQPLC